MKKRKPLLCDLFIANEQATKKAWVVPQKTVAHVRDTLYQAKRFVFDTEASRYMGEMQREIPHALCHAQEFAIQPFKTMYVEVDNLALWQAVNPTSLPSADMDGRLGYLFDDGRVYVIAGDWEEFPDAILMPISYRLFCPAKVEEEQKLCEAAGISRMSLDLFFWGSMYSAVTDEDKRAFRANHSIRIEMKPDTTQANMIKVFDILLSECAGELRNIIAILLFLNRTSQTRIEDHVPMHHSMIGRKPSALLSHSVVHFSLNPTPAFRETWGTGSAWRREHDVRGHFCHDKVSRAWCRSHNWVEYDVNQWRCMDCGGKKWWRREHKRGHRDKGQMVTTYEVHT